ncbi:FAD-binding oxidoreductase [Occultella glacieicola]|uniref:FAD-binding oxidoreductase n=1 Tax=Occultella glacieicola TaxID=2518684 RepID=A0ABY2DX98_9MICO|nr:FAD-binding oxidoreductase [Occultella glacieicola]
MVIGAGVLGAAAARELAAAGVEVTLLEAQHPGAGTSGTSFAWVNSSQKRPEAYRRLNAMAMAEHDRFAGDGAPWWSRRGHLRWAHPGAEDEALAVVRAEVEREDYPVEVLTRTEALALEPGLILPEGVEGVTYFPTEGHCYPLTMIARMIADLRGHGGRVRYPCAVTEVNPRPGGVRVRLADGEWIEADGAIVCVGRWTEALMKSAGAHIPLQPYTGPGSSPVGFLGVTSPLAVSLDRLVTTPSLNLRPHGGGRILLQAPRLDADADPASTPPLDGTVARELLAELAGALRDAAGGRLESLVVGWRVLPEDRLTVAGFVDDDRRLYTIATHSGVTLAPLLGRLAREEIVDGTDAPDLADFRPTRFRSRSTSTPAAAEPVRISGYQ